jgi:hypothetical protein
LVAPTRPAGHRPAKIGFGQSQARLAVVTSGGLFGLRLDLPIITWPNDERLKLVRVGRRAHSRLAKLKPDRGVVRLAVFAKRPRISRSAPSTAAVSTSVRFDPAVRQAIDEAARDDARSTSSLIQKVMIEWLKERKYRK